MLSERDKAIAEILRGEYSTHASSRMSPYIEMNRTVEEIALKLADYFNNTHVAFNPLEFLDACSPDPDLYPFSELWEDHVSG